jgi:prepilin-type processing-associated H-X9-DG protein
VKVSVLSRQELSEAGGPIPQSFVISFAESVFLAESVRRQSTSLIAVNMERAWPTNKSLQEIWRRHRRRHLILCRLVASKSNSKSGVRTMTRNGHLRLPTCLESSLILGLCGLLLLALFLPAYQEDRGYGRLVQCRINLKQISRAFQQYSQDYGQFPDLATSGGSSPASWRVSLRRYLEDRSFPEDYHFKEPWDSEANLPVAKQSYLPMQCPAAYPSADDLGRRYTGYAAVIGPNTLFPNGRGRRPSEVTRGLSQTIAVVEACGRQIVWTEPRDIELADETLGVNLPGPTPGLLAGLVTGFHREGAHVLFTDGSVKLLSTKTSPEVLRDMLRATDD